MDLNRISEYGYVCRKLVEEQDPAKYEDNCLNLKSLLDEVSSPLLPDEGSEKYSFGGIAIRPFHSALCVRDYPRTVKFAQALFATIKKAMEKFQERPIRILDATCGPYALLPMIMAPLFKKDEVEFTALDIYPEAIGCAKRVAEYLGQSSKYKDFIMGDAARYKIKEPRPHVIITEAMQSLLLIEPQVAITANLGNKTVDGGFFLPEEVRISAEVVNRERSIPLGDVFVLTRDIGKKARRAGAIDEDKLERIQCIDFTVQKPDQLKSPAAVRIHTSARIFESIGLQPEEAVITRTRSLRLPRVNRKPQNIQVRFKMGDASRESVDVCVI